MKLKKTKNAGKHRKTNLRHSRTTRYISLKTNPEDDARNIHTDGENSGENIEPEIRRSNRNVDKSNRYGSEPYIKIFWANKNKDRKLFSDLLQVQRGTDMKKGTPQLETIQKPADFHSYLVFRI